MYLPEKQEAPELAGAHGHFPLDGIPIVSENVFDFSAENRGKGEQLFLLPASATDVNKPNLAGRGRPSLLCSQVDKNLGFRVR